MIHTDGYHFDRRLAPVFRVPGLPEEVPFFRTGSSVIGGYRKGSDLDVVVLFSEELHKTLIDFGYQTSYKNLEMDKLKYPNVGVEACLRKDEYNIIMVKDQDVYDKWMKATNLAAMMGLKEKDQRVLLFQFITEGLVRGTYITY